MTVVATTPVMMILEGGPLDGESQVVENVPTTPGATLLFNIPNFQTFDPTTDSEVVLGQGLQAIYAFVGSGPSPAPGDQWVTSWVFDFTGLSYIPTPPPVTPPDTPPVEMTQVWMTASSTLVPISLDDILVVTPGVRFAPQSAMVVAATVTHVASGVVTMVPKTSMSVTPTTFPTVSMSASASLDVDVGTGAADVLYDSSQFTFDSGTDPYDAGGPVVVDPEITLQASAAMAISPVPALSDLILSGGPTGYWPLNDPVGSTTAQELVAGMTGTVVGGTTFGVQDPWGDMQAVRFDGTTGFIYCLATGARVDTLLPYTIQGWYQSFTPTLGQQSGLLNFTTAPPPTPLGGTFSPAIYLTNLGRLSGFSYPNNPTELTATAGDGTWYHFAFTYDGDQNWYVFRNGTQVAQTLAGTAPQSNVGARLQMGISGNTTRGGYWNGALAHIAIYDRVLSSEEIATLAQYLPPPG